MTELIIGFAVGAVSMFVLTVGMGIKYRFITITIKMMTERPEDV